MHLKPLNRLAVAALFLVHFTVAGFGPLLDAYLESQAQEFVAHVEAERSRPCTVGHDHLFCQVCRVLGGAADGADAPIIATGSQEDTTAPPERFPAADSGRIAVANCPRAPPTA